VAHIALGVCTGEFLLSGGSGNAVKEYLERIAGRQAGKTTIIK
jgi:hypothetical protein